MSTNIPPVASALSVEGGPVSDVAPGPLFSEAIESLREQVESGRFVTYADAFCYVAGFMGVRPSRETKMDVDFWEALELIEVRS